MKHIVLFSGGAASAYVAWLVAQEQKKEDIILLHTPTYSEHPDADRFRKQVSDYIGIPITTAEDGRNIWDLIIQKQCLPSFHIPYCTQVLKQIPRVKYLKTIEKLYTIYIGFGPDEYRRVQKMTARDEWPMSFPLFEKNISGEEVKRIIRQEWKICLPEPYLYLEHNNCIPCFKGGKAHFFKVWKYYPNEFQKAVEAEIYTGHTVFKDITLPQLALKWRLRGEQENLFDEETPCLCAF